MKTLARAAALLLMLAVAGCGSKDPRAPASGKVTLNGKGPLTGGTIQFVAADNPDRTASAPIKADGTYTLPDAPVGECKVVVTNAHLDPNPKLPAGETPPGAGKGVPGGFKGGPPGPGKDLKDSTKDKAAADSKGLKILAQEKAEMAGLKYVPLEPSFTKADGTPLRATVDKGGSTDLNFDVKDVPDPKGKGGK